MGPYELSGDLDDELAALAAGIALIATPAHPLGSEALTRGRVQVRPR